MSEASLLGVQSLRGRFHLGTFVPFGIFLAVLLEAEAWRGKTFRFVQFRNESLSQALLLVWAHQAFCAHS